jgi:NADH:ubiquinone oxidoreductase subunit 5 (subunit L)/multisubunit Na+/H+ antiporter MnhA subunit
VIEILLMVALATPLAVALLLAVQRTASEPVVARFSQGAAAVSSLASFVAAGAWAVRGARPLATSAHVLFQHADYRFVFQLTLDGASVVFLVLVQFTTGTVLRFSRFYLHREPGFQRFFATVLMFQSAMCVLALAGNLDLMFAGWEMVGFASFLLIAFYRERHSAVRNALKTYSIYRVADVGMLLAACMAERGSHRIVGLFLLLAAMGKSAQLPFSFWVPRAMEGPTPSSALFYGALSVHAGAYLLLRTFDIWGDVIAVRICVGLVGASTAALCSMFSRVQPTIKGQVGYASVTQVGVIFVELALGLPRLALAHIVCNALLRCYQLLVSPSAVAYLLRRQTAAGWAPRARSSGGRWASTLYVFALSEGYLKEMSKHVFWRPFRTLGRIVMPWRTAIAGLVVAGLGIVVACARGAFSHDGRLAWAFLGVALPCSACAIGSWQRPLRVVAWTSASALAVAAAVFIASPAQNAAASAWYASALGALCLAGLFGTWMVVPGGKRIARYAGLGEARPLGAALALVWALGVAGFPLLPTFVGEDLLVHDILHDSILAATIVAGVLALDGYLAVRNFAFTFLGQSSYEAVTESSRTSVMPRRARRGLRARGAPCP